jgi:hypothetical protein
VRLEVLLHVVGARKLLCAPGIRALNGLLGRVDLGVARGVTRGCEGLLATVAVPIPAWVSLARAFRRRARASSAVIFVG